LTIGGFRIVSDTLVARETCVLLRAVIIAAAAALLSCPPVYMWTGQ